MKYLLCFVVSNVGGVDTLTDAVPRTTSIRTNPARVIFLWPNLWSLLKATARDICRAGNAYVRALLACHIRSKSRGEGKFTVHQPAESWLLHSTSQVTSGGVLPLLTPLHNYLVMPKDCVFVYRFVNICYCVTLLFASLNKTSRCIFANQAG